VNAQAEQYLTYRVFVSDIRPIVTDNRPSDTSQPTWSPISATLIAGRQNAVLVDPLMTIEDARALADWVAATQRNPIMTHTHMTLPHSSWRRIASASRTGVSEKTLECRSCSCSNSRRPTHD
jgi:hypothetical protein